MKAALNHLLLGLTLAATSAAAIGADFPLRPIRIVVNASPGNLMDTTLRTVARQMSENLGQPIVVENLAGAAGLIGIRAVKAAKADGYTILNAANTLAQTPAFKKDPGYDLEDDFVSIGMVIRAPFIMVGPPEQPARTLADFIAQAKANPNAMTVASGGVGTSTHMAAALFRHQAGIKMVDVFYKGNAAALPDVMAGRINAIFDGGSTAGPAVKEGRLRAFGITSPQRSPTFSEIPTIAEQGLPDYSFFVYHTLAVPSGTPVEVVQRLNQALRHALTSEPVRARLRQDGSEAWSTSPDQATEYLRRDMRQAMKIVSEMGLPQE